MTDGQKINQQLFEQSSHLKVLFLKLKDEKKGLFLLLQYKDFLLCLCFYITANYLSAISDAAGLAGSSGSEERSLRGETSSRIYLDIHLDIL